MTLAVLDRDATAAAAPCPGAAVAARHAEIAVRGLRKRFGDRLILDGVDLKVGKGEAVALIGSNGAGKSTLLRCCLRLIELDDGSVNLLGEELVGLHRSRLRRLRARVGFVFQRHNLVPRLSVLSNVLHGAQSRRDGPRSWFHSFAPADLRAEAMYWLAQVGLADLALQRADTLSGGQSQRVAIARALMQKPELMLADEPVASLDPTAGEEVMRLFTDLLRRHNLTFLYTSHNLRHATEYADRVVGLRNGRIAVDAPAAGADLGALHTLYER